MTLQRCYQNIYLFNLQYDIQYFILLWIEMFYLFHQVTAVDNDPPSTQNGQIRYSIVSPVEAQALFQINPVTGQITARVSLSIATQNNYTVSDAIQILEFSRNLNFSFNNIIKCIHLLTNIFYITI